ncbi:MAG: relaxase domain-containing protein [Alphaproteobacteria bacterium]|uniref:Relaxase domain-containing protein n=1 Tax=Candidatus Nitrobium versatile TaxID=2884831 RepID=A0A953J266_9BACT|nr:relaxase domain-containing protein [Candidatus Nitrobium versatile]
MLSIGRMYTHFEQYTSKEDYYTKTEGTWHGKGAELQGLSGTVEKEQFHNIRAGKNPSGEQQLVPDGVNGKHRDGYDLTFSAPKSVSMLREFGGEEIRAAIDRAWDRSIEMTMRHVEENFIQARHTTDGHTEKVSTGDAIWAKFDHETSRELDPQKHSHITLMNATYNEQTGKWQALSNEALYNNKMYIGQYQRNEFAIELKNELVKIGCNVEFQADHKGLFEVKGFSKDDLKEFSRRSEQIKEKLETIRKQYPNASPAKQAEIAAIGSRAEKQDVNMEMVRESWKERAEGIGINQNTIRGRLQHQSEREYEAGVSSQEPKPNEYNLIRQAARILNENESTFTKEKLLRVAGKLSIGVHRISDLERAFSRMAKSEELIHLGSRIDRQGGKTEWYTTQEMLQAEKEIVQKVKDGQGKAEAPMPKQEALESLKKYEAERQQSRDSNFAFTEGQRRAAEHILTSKDRVIGIQGDAGTGKTTFLDAVREIAENRGYKVRGLSFTGKAASEIELKSSIKSQTTYSFLEKRLDPSETLVPGREIWIVDEASMTGSCQLKDILDKAEETDAKVVLVGDTKQLQSIEAGRIFSSLQTRSMNITKLEENLRQKRDDYKEIVKDIKEKQMGRAFEKMEATGKVHEIADRKERMGTIVKDYASCNNFKETIIVTARNKDRNELNADIRRELKEQGRLAEKEHTFTVRESKNLTGTDRHFAQAYREGDFIYTREAGINGRAGTEAKVESLDYDRHIMTVTNKDGGNREIDLKKYGDKLSAYTEKQQSFSAGDKIVFLKNDKKLGVQNGITGELQSINKDGNMTVRTESGKDIPFNIKEYQYIDHGYAVTDYKSQGQTARNVIYHADTSKGVNYNQAYVAITRGKEDLQIYTEDKNAFKENVVNEVVKTSTLDYSAPEKSGYTDSFLNVYLNTSDQLSGSKTYGNENGHSRSYNANDASFDVSDRSFDNTAAEMSKDAAEDRAVSIPHEGR